MYVWSTIISVNNTFKSGVVETALKRDQLWKVMENQSTDTVRCQPHPDFMEEVENRNNDTLIDRQL